MFGRRVKLVTLFGFEVKIDASWLLLAVLVVWTLAAGVFPVLTPGLARESYWWMAVAGAAGLFASVIFHEMAHALVARRYGIPIRGITLFIFGGVAEMDGEPETARSEFLMALAGPAASLALALALLFLAGWGRETMPPAESGILRYLGIINGALALFNLIPAFPLDGGRMLRAVLWQRRGDIVEATRIAAGAGNFFGIALIALGVLGVVSGDFVGGMWRFLIGMFLRGAAEASYQQTVTQRTPSGITVSQVMTPMPIAVAPELSVAEFIDDYVYRWHHRIFPVERQGLLVGQMGTQEAAALDRALWPTTPVNHVMQPCPPDQIIDPGADANVALTRMRRTGATRLFVVEEGRLRGVVTLRDMLEMMSTRMELDGARLAPGGARRDLVGSERKAMQAWVDRQRESRL
ncbi:MAG TPA: site-2 protease family protein [Stellaceae bacterium]|nr:site-2 protease family protein [Stellaceae bacterium]